MRNFLIIGLGTYGMYLATYLQKFKNDVTIIDSSVEKVEKYKTLFNDISVADCTDVDVLKSYDIKSYDVCFVSIGDNFESCAIVTALLKELGAKFIVAKAKKRVQVDILKKIGADEVVYPEYDVALKTAETYAMNNVFDYIKIPNTDYDIYEIQAPAQWFNKRIVDLQLRANYDINIIGIIHKHVTDMNVNPNYALNKEDHLLIICPRKALEKINNLK